MQGGSYASEEVERRLTGKTAVRDAAVPDSRQMLELLMRGERFCDGWW